MYYLFVEYIWLMRQLLYECPELAFMFVYMYINGDYSALRVKKLCGKFNSSNFKGSQFDHCYMKDVTFVKCVFDPCMDTILYKNYDTNVGLFNIVPYKNLQKLILHHVTMENVSFHNQKIWLELHDCHIHHLTFNRCILQHFHFSNTIIHDGIFENTMFYDGTFHNTNLVDGTIKYCNMERTTFDIAEFKKQASLLHAWKYVILYY